MNAFVSSKFSHYPVIWMLHNRALNKKMTGFHEQCLRIMFNDKNSSFERLLENNKSISIHYGNIPTLVIQMYKVANSIFSKIMNKIPKLRGKLLYHVRYVYYSIHP